MRHEHGKLVHLDADETTFRWDLDKTWKGPEITGWRTTANVVPETTVVSFLPDTVGFWLFLDATTPAEQVERIAQAYMRALNAKREAE